MRRIWALLREGAHTYDPDEFKNDDGGTDQESVAGALAVHYLQEAGALSRHVDTPWRGRVAVMDGVGRRLEELLDQEPTLAERGRRIVELIDQLGSDHYRAEVWSEHLHRPAAEVAADLLELNRRDILGFFVWKHAWTLERHPGAEPGWADIEAKAEERRAAVADKSDRAKAFAKQRRGCRVRAMLEYFGADAPETCGRCDLCEPLPRPWRGSHISRDALLESLPIRRVVLQLLDDTRGTGYSRRNLERTLVGRLGSGDHSLPERLARHHLCGRLAFLGAEGVATCIEDLIEEGLARSVSSEHDGTAYRRLELTNAGLQYLRRIG